MLLLSIKKLRDTLIPSLEDGLKSFWIDSRIENKKPKHI